MSTSIDSVPREEQKEFDRQSGKDDQKQQSALRKRESKEADIPADASGGSSLVGGTIAAISGGVDRAIHMMPESLQTRASDLQSAIGTQASSLASAAAPVTEAYQNDGLLAAAKVAGGLVPAAVSTIKGQALDAGASLKQTVQAKLPTSLGGGVATEEAPLKKSKGRRRRGGRGHGHRGLKTRALPPKDEESIRDTLGEKAAEIKEVVVEDVSKASAASTGIIGSIKSTASGLVGSVQGAASGLVGSAKGAASGLVGSVQSSASGLVEGVKGAAASGAAAASGIVAKGQERISNLTSNSKDIKDETLETNNLTGAKEVVKEKAAPLKARAKQAAGKAKDVVEDGILAAKDAASSAKATIEGGAEKARSTLSRKPTLERRDELPSLGTPAASPSEGDVTFATKDAPMAVKPDPSAAATSSGIVATAKFYGEKALDAVKDKLDNMSMNADDDSEDSKAGALERAKDQLQGMATSLLGSKDKEAPVDKEEADASDRQQPIDSKKQ